MFDSPTHTAEKIIQLIKNYTDMQKYPNKISIVKRILPIE